MTEERAKYWLKRGKMSAKVREKLFEKFPGLRSEYGGAPAKEKKEPAKKSRAAQVYERLSGETVEDLRKAATPEPVKPLPRNLSGQLDPAFNQPPRWDPPESAQPERTSQEREIFRGLGAFGMMPPSLALRPPAPAQKKLAPIFWHEPSVPKGMKRDSKEYRTFADKEWVEALEEAKGQNRAIRRVSQLDKDTPEGAQDLERVKTGSDLSSSLMGFVGKGLTGGIAPALMGTVPGLMDEYERQRNPVKEGIGEIAGTVFPTSPASLIGRGAAAAGAKALPMAASSGVIRKAIQHGVTGGMGAAAGQGLLEASRAAEEAVGGREAEEGALGRMTAAGGIGGAMSTAMGGLPALLGALVRRRRAPMTGDPALVQAEGGLPPRMGLEALRGGGDQISPAAVGRGGWSVPQRFIDAAEDAAGASPEEVLLRFARGQGDENLQKVREVLNRKRVDMGELPLGGEPADLDKLANMLMRFGDPARRSQDTALVEMLSESPELVGLLDDIYRLRGFQSAQSGSSLIGTLDKADRNIKAPIIEALMHRADQPMRVVAPLGESDIPARVGTYGGELGVSTVNDLLEALSRAQAQER